MTVTLNRTLSIVAAVVASSLYRATNNLMKEGLEMKEGNENPLKTKKNDTRNPVKGKKGR